MSKITEEHIRWLDEKKKRLNMGKDYKHRALTDVMGLSEKDLLIAADDLTIKQNRQWKVKKCIFRNKYKIVMVKRPFGMRLKDAICILVSEQQGRIWNGKSPLAKEEIIEIANMETCCYLERIKTVSDEDLRKILERQLLNVVGGKNDG